MRIPPFAASAEPSHHDHASHPPSAHVWRRGLARRPPGIAERKQRVCAAAVRLLAAEGVSGLTFTRLNAAAGLPAGGVANLYGSGGEVLTDIVDAHLIDLTHEVGAAHDAAHAPGAEASPVRRLELLLRAFLDAINVRVDEHRAFLFCVHAMPEHARNSVLLRFQIVLETIRDVLAAAVPGLAADVRAKEIMLATIRTVLSDPWRWPKRHGPEQLQAEARRLAGMLLAAARAETARDWPALGSAGGACLTLKALTLDVRTARGRFSEMLKAAELGADITLTRRGRRVARVVGTGSI